MHKLTKTLFFLIFMPMAAWSQLPDDFPSVTQADFPDASVSSPRVFTGSSLFGYMNGGAELYLEYGFSLAAITEVSLSGGRYKIEVFKMNGPEEAFGIYSVSKFRCLDMPSYSGHTCRTSYQLQICKGQYYVSIINSNGTAADSAASARIGSLVSERIPAGELNLAGYLPGASIGSIKTGCFLARGPLGIVNGEPDLEDCFRGLKDFTAVILRGEEDYTISVKFGDTDSMNNFISQNNIGTAGDQVSGSDVNLPARLLSENHLIIKKHR